MMAYKWSRSKVGEWKNTGVKLVKTAVDCDRDGQARPRIEDLNEENSTVF